MKLLIGLGNPGGKYNNNRHNVGQRFVREAKLKVKSEKLKVMETDCFMNDSGSFVKKVVSRQQMAVSDLYIIHDDLDLPLGRYKIQLGIGPKVHYGVNSIEGALGAKDFWRIRIGIDNRQQAVGNRRVPGDEYVLQDFTKDEMKILEEVFSKIWNELTNLIS